MERPPFQQTSLGSLPLKCDVAHLLVYEKIKHQRPGGDTTKKAFTISYPKPDDEIFWTHCKTRWKLLGESHYARLCRREKEAWKT